MAAVQIFLAGLISSSLVRLINLTLRWEFVGLDGANRYWPHDEPRVLAFWHSQLLFMPWIYRNCRRRKGYRPIVALISMHGDGRIVARAMRFLGIDSIAGSSSRGGREALFQMINALKQGSHVAITPDGPKGPARKLKSGIVKIAQRSGAKIYPATIAARHKWTFGSWDKMILPKPFSRAVLIMGEPITVPPCLTSDETEQYALQVENALNELNLQGENHEHLGKRGRSLF